jgi:Negative regulator of sigma F
MTDAGMVRPRFASETGPSAAVRARIDALVEHTPALMISMRARIVAAVVLAALVTSAVILIASQLVYHRYASGLHAARSAELRLSLVLVLLVALTYIATLTAMWRGRRGFGSGITSLAIVTGLVPMSYAALVLINPVHGHDPVDASVAISPWGIRCLAISAIVGTVVLASFTVAVRRSVPVASRLRAAALGAAAGAWSGLSVFIFCTSGDIQHILIGHVLPIVVFTVVAMAAIPRTLRP